MGLFLRQDEQRSELQTKVSAELQERLRQKPSIENEEYESTALENQHQTRHAGMIIIGLLILLIIAIVVFAIRIS